MSLKQCIGGIGMSIKVLKELEVARGITMNLIEHYIKEIHLVEEVEKQFGKYIKTDITINCYGQVERKTKIFASWEDWEIVKKQGYYLA